MAKVKQAKEMIEGLSRFEEKYLDELLKYQEAYNILMDYFDDLDNETKYQAHKRLNKIGL